MTGDRGGLPHKTLQSVSISEFAQDGSYLVYQRAGQTRAFDAATQTEAFAGDAGPAIEHALAETTAGVVKLGAGTFACDRALELDASTWLVGSGDATTLTWADGHDHPLVLVREGSPHARVSNLALYGPNPETDPAPTGSGACVRVEGSWRVVLDHLLVRFGPGDGLCFPESAGESYEPVVFDVDVKGCRGDGYRLASAVDCHGVNVYAEANGGAGIRVAERGHVHHHAHAYASEGEAGIVVTDAAADTRLLAPWSENNLRHGIAVRGDRTTILNPYLYNNSHADASHDGVVLDANGCTVLGGVFNNFEDPQADGLGPAGYGDQRHHVREAGSFNNLVAYNHFLNPGGAAVDRYAYSDSRFRDNEGYVTEAGGEATVSDGDTVAHGLDETPVAYGANATDPGTVASVTAVDGADLTVAVRALADGSSASGVDVSWFASGPSAT